MLISKMVPVQEAYIGKTQNLIECEIELGKIIKRMKVPFEKVGKRIVDAPAINKSKENKKICELLKKEFGFKEFYLHWDGDDTVNGCTWTEGVILRGEKKLPTLPLKQGQGKYYDHSHEYICVVNIYGGLIDEGANAEELMAVILHEIGHNFTCTPVVTVARYLEPFWIPLSLYMGFKQIKTAKDRWKDFKDSGLPVFIFNADQTECEMNPTFQEFLKKAASGLFRFQKYVRTGLKDLDNFISSNQSLQEMIKYLNEFDQYVLDNKNKIMAHWDEYVRRVKEFQEAKKKNPDAFLWAGLADIGINIVSAIFNGQLTAIKNLFDSTSGYSDEVFADSFATAYGYGPATVSFQAKMGKMRTRSRFLSKKNKYSTYNQYVFILLDLQSMLTDPHPMDITRIKNQINKLERDLNDDRTPPEVKEIIKKDLDEANKIMEEYLKFDDKERNISALMNFQRINILYFGGKLEVRDLINRVLNVGLAEA